MGAQNLSRHFAHGLLRILEFEDRLFTEQRLQFYGTGVAAAYALSLVWRLFHGQWIFLSDGRPRCVDFGWMWLSSKFAIAGDLAKIFDYPAFAAAQLALFGHHNCPWITPYVYPPTYLFVTYFLGLLPYALAFAAWVLLTLFLYGLAVYAIIPRPAAVIAALAPFCVPVNADFGHNGFITAALIGFSLAYLERRPGPAGIIVGALTYKPQIGLLFPIALLASRNWRAVAASAATSIIFAVTAAVAFGPEGWSAFFHALSNRHASLSPDAAVPLALHSVFGLLRWIQASNWVSWVGHLTAAALVTLAVGFVWAKPIPYSLKAASLCIGSVAVSPYILFYDLCIFTIAVAFLVRDGLSRGFLPGEKTVLLLLFAGLFFVAVPIGPVVYAALLVLVARRIIAYRRLDQTAAAVPADIFEMKALAGD